MRRSIFVTALFFGGLIALVLLAIQYARLLVWPWRPLEGFAGAVGLVFLAAGIAVGVRIAPPGRAARETRRTADAPGAGTRCDSPLSPRETEILTSLAEGLSNQELAERHFVSVNTVKTHVRRICAKLAVRRRGQAVAEARRRGLLP